MEDTYQPESQKVNAGIFSKYFSIIVPVVLMLLLISGTAVFNYFSSAQQSTTTTDINLVARQAELSQSIAKDVMSLHLLVVTPEEGYSESSLEESVYLTDRKLEASVNTFDKTLYGLINGGTVTNVDGSTIEIDPIDIDEARYGLESGERMWVPFRQLIESFVESVRGGQIDEEVISFASDYARLFEGRLFNEMNDLNNLLTAKASRQAFVAQVVNGVALFVAFLLFFYIVLVALRRLVRADAALADARRETTEMMDTIQEGLFLIDADLQIGSQQSKELKHILPLENISGRALDDVLGKMVSESDLTNTRRFVKQLFNKRVKETLLDDLNPLRQVRLTVPNKNGLMETRYLRFKFNRVYAQKQIVRILVTVSNITEAVKLQQLLEQERQQNKEQTEMLMKVLHLDQDLLAGFVRRTTLITQRVNNMLKEDGNSQSQLRKKLDDIFREVHGFKGEASALDFDSFVAIAEEAEEKLKQLRGYDRLSGNDFMGVTVVLDRLIGLNEEIALVQDRLAGFGRNTREVANPVANLLANMDNFTRQIASRQHKQVELDMTGFEQAQHLPQQTADQLHEIITQLLRNAVVHGIELPEIRVADGKAATGNIVMEYKEADGRGELSVQDDGKGIDFQALRDKLRTDPRYAGKDIDHLDKKMLYRALFLPGLSTANASQDAGRGEGMSVIKDRVRQLPEGKISIHSGAGRFTRFVISFAVAKNGEK